MRFTKLSSTTKVSTEQRRLEKEHEDLLRRERELKKALVTIPKQIQKKKEKERKTQTLHVAGTAQSIPFGSRISRPVAPSRKTRSLPARELQNARIRFLLLCIVLASVVIMLWRAIPSK